MGPFDNSGPGGNHPRPTPLSMDLDKHKYVHVFAGCWLDCLCLQRAPQTHNAFSRNDPRQSNQIESNLRGVYYEVINQRQPQAPPRTNNNMPPIKVSQLRDLRL